MESELIELFEAVKKAADAAADGNPESSPEEDRCLDALKRLKKFPVNFQLLVSTQVGKRLIRHLTKHPRKKIQPLASNLIGLWKNIIVEETVKNKKNGGLDNKDSLKSKPASAKTSNSMKVEKVSKVEIVKEKNNSGCTLKSETVLKFENFSC